MGVIYKLKQEVVDYILQEKTSNPNLGCRQLAFLTSEKFQTNVSKSSVNDVIQKAHLSSPIGRRPSLIKKVKRFQIPSQKKSEFLSHIPVAVEDQPEQPLDRDTEDLVSSIPLSPFKDPQARRASFSRRHDGVGLIFLKAAEWEVAPYSILGRLLKKHIKEQLPSHFDQLSEALLWLKFLGIKTFADIEQFSNHALWPLHGLNSSDDLKNILQQRKTISSPEDLKREYFSEVKKAFTGVNYSKIILEDGDEIILDAQLRSVWKDKVPACLSWPINKAMPMLLKYFVNNDESIIFLNSSQILEDYPLWHKLIAVLEGVEGKRMAKISLLGEDHQELDSVSTIPFKTRKVIVSFWPQQNLFKQVYEVLKPGPKMSLYHQLSEQTVYFSEAHGVHLKEISATPLRIVWLWEKKEGYPTVALVTNIKETEAPQIIESYLTRWPHWELAKDVETSPATDHQNKANTQIQNFWDLFEEFTSQLERYVRKYYFNNNLNNIFSIVQLPGSLLSLKNAFIVRLSCAKSNALFPFLSAAVKRLNEAYVLDPSGRRVMIRIAF